jgi:hypothetical protein
MRGVANLSRRLHPRCCRAACCVVPPPTMRQLGLVSHVVPHVFVDSPRRQQQRKLLRSSSSALPLRTARRCSASRTSSRRSTTRSWFVLLHCFFRWPGTHIVRVLRHAVFATHQPSQHLSRLSNLAVLKLASSMGTLMLERLRGRCRHAARRRCAVLLPDCLRPRLSCSCSTSLTSLAERRLSVSLVV